MVFTLIGIVVLFGCVLGGFLLEGGPFATLIQPIEILIIGGAAIGSLILGTPGKHLGPLFSNVLHALLGSGATKAEYRELFQLLFEVFSVMRKNGDMAGEKDGDNPQTSPFFSKNQ